MRLLFFLIIFFIAKPAYTCTSWMVLEAYLTLWEVMLLTHLLLLLLPRTSSEAAAAIRGRGLAVTAVTTAAVPPSSSPAIGSAAR